MMGTSAEHEQGLMGRKPPHRSILYKKANNFPRRESYLPSSRTNSVPDKKTEKGAIWQLHKSRFSPVHV